MSAQPRSRSVVCDGELARELARALGHEVTTLSRRASRYATSATIEDVDVTLRDGSSLALTLKDLSRPALLAAARGVKAPFLRDPEREIDTYRLLLCDAALGTPVCHSAVADRARGRYWLALERVPGVELYQVGELDRWEHAARWLAGMHEKLAPRIRDGSALPALLVHDRDACRRWMRRACAFAPDGAAIRRLAAVHEAALDRLLALPVTVIHGDLFASNVLLCGPAGAERVCALDWEMAGIGPGLLDLASLVSGGWDEEERTAIALAYHVASQHEATGDTDVFLADLDVCRLQLCIQLLGWSADWAPPGDHDHDWLGEALELVERLGL